MKTAPTLAPPGSRDRTRRAGVTSSTAAQWGFRILTAALTVLMVAIVAMPGPTSAAERLALVIGVGAYERVSTLDNPARDARLMARSLRETGFETTLLTDGNQRDLQRAIVAFGRDLRRAGPGTTALFYFAGHGVQAGGRNFLIPTDADIADAADLDIAAVPVSWVMGQMESAGTTNIIILDACRNNPFARSYRSASSGGLARENAPTGSFIAFATAPGGVAVDGIGNNSPYTAALARAIKSPGLAIEQVFKRVRVDVLQATGGEQVPWESSSLIGEFFFSGDAAAARPGARPAPETPVAGAPVAEQPREEAPTLAILPQAEETPSPPLDRPRQPSATPAGRIAVRIDIEYRSRMRPCRDNRRIRQVTLPLGPAASPVEARASLARPALDFSITAKPAGRGAEITLIPSDGDTVGKAATLTLDSIDPGTLATLYSDVRHPAAMACGGMVVHARVLE
ncbi:MAG: caspase family protein [Pseudomonadota bacterium]